MTQEILKLELNRAEVEALHEALEITISELGMEIADTDRKAYRDEIKAKRDALAAILNRLLAASRAA